MSDIIENILPYSPFLTQHIRNGILTKEQLLPLVKSPLPTDFFDEYTQWQDLITVSNEVDFKKKLRQLRLLVFSHIMVRDLAHISTLDEVTTTITQFADFSINIAYQFAEKYFNQRYGEPIGELSEQPIHLSAVAMGKMGGYELNTSSDIDLIFVYPENGETNGHRKKSNHEFFHLVGQKLISLLNDHTEYGRVFRVDMRLRPNGDSGPLVISETGLENYLITQGREWERYAWTKERVITPYENSITEIIRPFVFRKYLDYEAYESLRKLHRQIKQEIIQKESFDNIKQGEGGIREIEFIAQIFQIIQGGRVIELQLKGTQETLKALQQLKILEEQVVQSLLEAYVFLRNVEHRLQYWEDQQTQILPQQPLQQELLAKSMGYSDYTAFLKELNQYRKMVNHIFTEILQEPENENQESTNQLNYIWDHPEDSEKAVITLEKLGFSNCNKLLKRIIEIKKGSKYRHLSTTALRRFDSLIPQIIEAVSQINPDEKTIIRMFDLLESIGNRSSYLALLCEHPEILKKITKIIQNSRWISDYLIKHPILMDELINAELLDTDLNWKEIKLSLQTKLDLCKEDIELQMNVIRHFKHSLVFKLAVQEIEGLWKIESLSDQLSSLADLILDVSMKKIWEYFKKAHQPIPQFAIIAYGKLGGKELTYSSDLDLVYLFNDPLNDATEIYSRYATRITSFLSAITDSGELYDIDLRLRPNGESGFIASDFTMYQDYLHNHAWTWEQQVLTRGRFVCGYQPIEHQFNQLRKEILMKNRDQILLKEEIIQMREKMTLTHPPHIEDVKYARGGIADVEFIVQYIALGFSHKFSELTENLGNIALLKIAAEYKIIDLDLAEGARIAYRDYRRILHNSILHDTPPVFPKEQLLQNYQVVKKLWFQVFQQEII